MLYRYFMRRSAAAILTALLLFSLASCDKDGGAAAHAENAAQTGTGQTPPPPASGHEESTGADPRTPGPEVPETSPAQAALSFTRETMPRLDGSTSTAPLALAVCAELLGETEEEAADLVRFSKTTNAYLHLLRGEADLLIVGEPNDEVFAEKERLGFSWEQTPFATDAFVFLVNEENPVDSITVEQARDIYTGRITNWKELGGEDREIIPLQRNSGAGSQTLMDKLVMRGEAMMDAPTEYIAASMGDLMAAVKSYDSSAGAIGYSVYYYAEEMKMARGLKLLKLDGVAPDPGTIRNETYPLVNPKYVVIPADAAPDAPNRLLYDWLLSEEGQRLVAEEGYVSVMDLAVTLQLTPLVGGRWYEEYTPDLLPRDDYGQLIPYAGQRLSDEWPAATGCLYGLMTKDGNAVTDPVFTRVSAPAWYDAGIRRMPLLILERSEDGKKAVAAADGSRITDYAYDGWTTGHECLTLFSEDSFTLMAIDGTIEAVFTREELGFAPRDPDDAYAQDREQRFWLGDRKGDLIALWTGADGILAADLANDELITMPPERWDALPGGSGSAPDEEAVPIEGAERIYDQLLGQDAPYLLRLPKNENGFFTEYWYLSDGTPLPEFTLRGGKWYQSVSLAGGLIEKLDLNTAGYYDLGTRECVFRTHLGFEAE